MKQLKRLFGGLEIGWGRLILFAVICGVYTGVMALLPFARDTSFQDITISFECWILFGILLIVNGKSPLDAALKTLVFFLISQPLVYLVQVPFHRDGFGLFRYYPTWLRWTLLTFPMAYVGWYMKKDKWWGLLILSPMLFFLAWHYLGFFSEVRSFFPHHLLSALFCAATMLIYPPAIFENRSLRIAGAAVSAVLLLAATGYGLLSAPRTYSTDLLLSGSETCGIEYDDSFSVSLEDERFGTVTIRYEEAIDSWLVHAEFTKTGHTRLVLEAPDGTKVAYELEIRRDSYDVRRVE